MRCMLLEDYGCEKATPKSLENVLNYFKQEGIVLTKQDIIIVFIYILMLESGFVPYSVPSSWEYSHEFNFKQILLLAKTFPKNWKRNLTYNLSFVLPPFPRSLCIITGIDAADDLIINCHIKGFPEGNFSLLLDPSLHVIDITQYQNLRQLSLNFKNSISHPSKLFLFAQHGYISSMLQHMPLEIVWKILKYCDIGSLRNLSKTSLFFQKIVNDGKFLNDTVKVPVKKKHVSYFHL